MAKKLRHACRFLHHNEKIVACLSAIEHNGRLLHEVCNSLPRPLDRHCLHATLEAGVLTLLTDSPVWSSRLRFFAPELGRVLAPKYGSISQCRIRIRPTSSLPSKEDSGATGKRGLSSKAIQHLLEAAEGIEDEEIAAALRRLAGAGAGGCQEAASGCI